jgi:hypothetical protein
MTGEQWWMIGSIVGIVLVLALLTRLGGKGTGRPGPGAAGTIYDMLNQDRRKAIEIIVEDRAEARDPEDADGNLPDLENPREIRLKPDTTGNESG